MSIASLCIEEAGRMKCHLTQARAIHSELKLRFPFRNCWGKPTQMFIEKIRLESILGEPSK